MSCQRSAGYAIATRNSFNGKPEPTCNDVASLSEFEIRRMSDDQMVRIICSIRGQHLLDELAERLPYLDRATLTRLTFLTRRYCQNRAG